MIHRQLVANKKVASVDRISMKYVFQAWRFVGGVGPAMVTADYAMMLRYGVSGLATAVGAVMILVGLVLFPLPIPLGLPLIVVGLIVVLNSSKPAKRAFLRWLRRRPGVTKKLRSVIRRRGKRVSVNDMNVN